MTPRNGFIEKNTRPIDKIDS
jgi:hypothetical protein